MLEVDLQMLKDTVNALQWIYLQHDSRQRQWTHKSGGTFFLTIYSR